MEYIKNIGNVEKEQSYKKLDHVHKVVRDLAIKTDVVYGIEINKKAAIPIMHITNEVGSVEFAVFVKKISAKIKEMNDDSINVNYDSDTEQLDIYIYKK